MNIISWNVNGFRAVVQKGFFDFIKKEKPEIFCLQEIKAEKSQMELGLLKLEYPFIYVNSAEKKGYSGTAIFSKIEPVDVKYGIGIDEHDNEGRIITLEFETYFLINVYTPNSGRGVTRLDYRQVWDKEFLDYVKTLEKRKPVIFCGDLNVAYKEIDLANPNSNKTTKTKPGNAGFTDQERKGFDNIIENGFIDTFRYLYPDKVKYSWWSYMFNSREKNVGWRIDYFCVSKSLINKVKDSQILNEVMGSDHCPIKLVLE